MFMAVTEGHLKQTNTLAMGEQNLRLLGSVQHEPGLTPLEQIVPDSQMEEDIQEWK